MNTCVECKTTSRHPMFLVDGKLYDDACFRQLKDVREIGALVETHQLLSRRMAETKAVEGGDEVSDSGAVHSGAGLMGLYTRLVEHQFEKQKILRRNGQALEKRCKAHGCTWKPLKDFIFGSTTTHPILQANAPFMFLHARQFSHCCRQCTYRSLTTAKRKKGKSLLNLRFHLNMLAETWKTDRVWFVDALEPHQKPTGEVLFGVWVAQHGCCFDCKVPLALKYMNPNADRPQDANVLRFFEFVFGLLPNPKEDGAPIPVLCHIECHPNKQTKHRLASEVLDMENTLYVSRKQMIVLEDKSAQSILEEQINKAITAYTDPVRNPHGGKRKHEATNQTLQTKEDPDP